MIYLVSRGEEVGWLVDRLRHNLGISESDGNITVLENCEAVQSEISDKNRTEIIVFIYFRFYLGNPLSEITALVGLKKICPLVLMIGITSDGLRIGNLWRFIGLNAILGVSQLSQVSSLLEQSRQLKEGSVF